VFVALILEEIAIDSHHAETEARLLDEAQELHLSSLLLAMRAFGENNVQTAKHYGNLGRLYQSMHKFAVSTNDSDNFIHHVSRNCSNLSELHQIFNNFDNCWQKHSKEAKIMRDALIFHLT